MSEAPQNAQQASGEPGATNETAGQSPDYEAPGAAARVSDNPPPGTNQPSTEPIPADNQESAPSHGSLSSSGAQSPNPPALSATGSGAPRATVAPRGAVPTASKAPGMQGEAPEGSDVEPTPAGVGKAGAPASLGNAHGVSVAATQSLEGSSEDTAQEQGMSTPTPSSPSSLIGGADAGGTAQVHRPSAPDGEVSA